MIYNVIPMGAVRMNKADAWKKRPVVLRYFRFKDDLRASGLNTIPEGGKIIFRLPMPASWSGKRKREADGKPHTQKPDLDNMLKAVLDTIYEEDCHIWNIGGLEKYWAYEGSIEIK